ncbi:MAG: SAM-dependent methyltransferase [Leptolyngbyaceae cyanobacterium]
MARTQPIRPDIAFIPTPDDAIAAMLDLAQVRADDVVYDLGCGDGRLLIQAAKLGARGVGIDIDPVRIAEAQRLVFEAGVSDRLQFEQGNLYESHFEAATVVMLYLLPHLNVRLLPRLRSQLRPGSRIVSHQFDMEGWEPDRVVKLIPSEEDSTLYLWVV